MNKIINIAVIAHVDAGKSTLVDALLQQSGVFGQHEQVTNLVMDSNQLERERGITIYSKNCSIMYQDIKINIVDTPGHSDFSSEVERIIRTVDTVILLVDASEGPMPQTKFVLQKSLELGLKPILLINKVDKKDARCEEVIEEVFELFITLGANNEQIDFPILYGIAKQGIVRYTLTDQNTDIEPLLATIVKHTGFYHGKSDGPLQLQISNLAFDDYIGRLGIGRIYQGTIKENSEILVIKNNGEQVNKKITQLFTYSGLKRLKANVANVGDIVIIGGISDISIGDTLCDKTAPLPLAPILIEEPTLVMNFLVNKSPFAGKEGKFITTRNLKERLEKELEVNVGLRVEELSDSLTDGFRVAGRGELHLSILLENLRREGYEVAVSKPEVVFHYDNDNKLEPIEQAMILVPEEYAGGVIASLNLRKGLMENYELVNNQARISYKIPTRGLIGFQQEFINITKGEGILVRNFVDYEIYKGTIPERPNGVLIANELGVTTAYALSALEERGKLLLGPGVKVYEGMIVGIHSKSNDLTVNPCKNKKLTNMRASGSDDSISLTPPIILNLEQALEFIARDELVEITPKSIRIRKKGLTASERKINN